MRRLKSFELRAYHLASAGASSGPFHARRHLHPVLASPDCAQATFALLGSSAQQRLLFSCVLVDRVEKRRRHLRDPMLLKDAIISPTSARAYVSGSPAACTPGCRQNRRRGWKCVSHQLCRKAERGQELLFTDEFTSVCFELHHRSDVAESEKTSHFLVDLLRGPGAPLFEAQVDDAGDCGVDTYWHQ